MKDGEKGNADDADWADLKRDKKESKGKGRFEVRRFYGDRRGKNEGMKEHH